MRALLVLGLLAFGATELSAQKAMKFGIEGGGVYATVDGDDFQGTDAGIGFQAQVRNVGSAFTIGAGVVRTSHAVEGTDEKLAILGLMLEPRYTFASAASFRPFLAGRAGMVRETMSATVLGTAYDMEATGTAFGGGGGLAFNLSPNMELNLVATYNMLSFGDVKVNGDTQSGTDTSGSSVTLQASLMFIFGGGK